jgi:ATP-dependent DNA helicase RecQ
MHENFIIAMGGNITADTNKAVRGYKLQKKSSAEESLDIILSGKNITETAEIRTLTEGTIISHLEELAEQNKLPKEKLTHLIEKGNKDTQIILKALEKDETGKLKPVFDALKGKYPYEQIRLIRLFL